MTCPFLQGLKMLKIIYRFTSNVNTQSLIFKNCTTGWQALLKKTDFKNEMPTTGKAA